MQLVVNEDLRDLETVKDTSLLMLLAEILPTKVGSPLSLRSLEEDLQVSQPSITRWVNILSLLYYSFTIAPYGSPKIRAVKKLKKLYMWDWSLLKTDRYIELNNEPYRLREEVLSLKNKSQLVIIDEVQKIPLLLDEVHWLIENTDHVFALLGSSARRLKRGHGNLLGGRAIRYELSGLVSQELGDDFNLERIINHGYLPNHYIEDSPRLLIKSYVSDYLKEEIAEEGLVRSLQKFSRFLEVAALSDTQIVNYTKISNDCSVSASTVKDYFQILVDTLLGNYLNSYKKSNKKNYKSP